MNPLRLHTRQLLWLIRRELWEGRWYLLGLPVLVSLALLALKAPWRPLRHAERIARDMTSGALVPEWLGPLHAPQFWMVTAMMLTFYCSGALQDERKDKSILFWKSMPVSDLQTVLSKLIVAMLLVPLWALMVELCMQLVLLGSFAWRMALQGYPDHAWQLLSPASWHMLLPSARVYIAKVTLWALPNLAWLLMVSAGARNKALMWALGLPFGLGMLATAADFALGTELKVPVWSVALRLTTSLGPVEHDRLMRTFAETRLHAPDHQDLELVSLVLGAVAGIAMLAMAVHLRRRSAEL
jgi:ABC-2 type transport system permease protein